MSESLGPLTAGLDAPVFANNDPDPRLVWWEATLVADCRSQWLTREKSEAYARLFAAAPDMLDALRDVFACVEVNTDGVLCNECVAKVAAAIAKAAGKEAPC